MSEKLYKMSDVARLHNITKKTLRYYEKINLFSPDYISGLNNYKYYTRKNFPTLKQIIYLKDIGFTLDQIKHLLENRSHELIISELHKKHDEISLSIEKLLSKRESINYKISFYERAKEIDENDFKRPSIQVFNHRKTYKLKSQECSKESIMLTYRRILGRLRELNKLSHQLYGTVYSNDEQTSSGSFIILPSNSSIDNEDIIPAGKYITMYHKGSYYNKEALQYLKDWLSNNNYTPIGDFYDFCIVDRTFTNNEDSMIMELQVRVK